jgi:hypothetical protein
VTADSTANCLRTAQAIAEAVTKVMKVAMGSRKIDMSTP